MKSAFTEKFIAKLNNTDQFLDHVVMGSKILPIWTTDLLRASTSSTRDGTLALVDSCNINRKLVTIQPILITLKTE